jgi:ubiquinone/menaquinone biosynthesis C-methylase UbiE
MEVLEFGCGTGSTAIAHAPYVKHIRATDISSKMIEIAQGKARAANVNNVTFEAAAIDDLHITDQSLDAVLGFSVLHLLEDKEDIIDRVYQMLKPGGVYVTSTPCLGDNMRFFKFVGPIGRFLRLLPLIRVFTRKQLEDSITNAGFEIDHSWQPGKGKAVFIVATKSS